MGRIVGSLMTLAVLVPLTACAPPPEVDIAGTAGKPLPDVVERLEEQGLTVEVGRSDADPESDGWIVQVVTAEEEPVREGDTVSVEVWSVLERAADLCAAGEVQDSGRSLVLDMRGSDAGSGDLALHEVECVLRSLETPDATQTLMRSTRALDGRQEDAWDELQATWSYHPDNGLDIVFELAA